MHEGHRGRVRDRYNNGERFNELETLEFLLFYCIPRRDVKPLAKELLNKYGSIKGVVKAAEELESIEGISQKTLVFFKLLRDVYESPEVEEQENITSLSVKAMVEKFKEYFSNFESEQFAAIMMGKNGEELHRMFFTDNKRATVSIDVQELMRYVSKIRPHAVIIAHNHVSGSVMPSIEDDISTKRIAIMLNAQGVNFYDHIIFTEDDYYSYHMSGKLLEIKNSARASML